MPSSDNGRTWPRPPATPLVWRLSVSVAIGCVVLLGYDIASACRPLSSALDPQTVLGLDGNDTSLSILVPLNPVFSQPLELQRESGELVETVSIESGPLTGFSRSAELLLPNEVYVLGSMRFMTGDFTDEVPPTAPALVDAEWLDRDPGECGPFDELLFEIEPASDDTALADNLSYAVYFGVSEEAVLAARTPAEIVPASSLWVTLLGREPHFVAIEAIDPAGNVGPRSAALRPRFVDAGGCSVVHQSTPTTPLICMLLGVLAIWRSRARFPR